jgi:hypothetical protein
VLAGRQQQFAGDADEILHVGPDGRRSRHLLDQLGIHRRSHTARPGQQQHRAGPVGQKPVFIGERDRALGRSPGQVAVAGHLMRIAAL